MSRDILSMLPDEVRALHFEEEVASELAEIEKALAKHALGAQYSLNVSLIELANHPKIRLAYELDGRSKAPRSAASAKGIVPRGRFGDVEIGGG